MESPDAKSGAHGDHELGRAALLRGPDIWAERQLSPTEERFMEICGERQFAATHGGFLSEIIIESLFLSATIS